MPPEDDDDDVPDCIPNTNEIQTKFDTLVEREKYTARDFSDGESSATGSECF